MAGGTLGSLTIDLAANITRFEQSLTRAERLADKRSKSIQRTFTRMATGLGAALASFGFVRAVEQSLEFADSIGKTADKLGIATDALQEYRFAAEQTGVSQQALDVGLQRFSRRVAEAAEGSGVLNDVLERLNIPLRDAEGNLRSTEVVLDDYADAIKNAGSSNEQLLLAFKAFDTEGVAFVNTLKGGSSGLQAFRNEAQALGIVMSEDLIRNAEKASDELDKVSKILKIQLSSAVVALAPQITAVAQAFTDLVKGDAGNIPQWSKNIATGFAEVTEGAKGVGSTVEALYKILNLDLLDVGQIPAIWDDYLAQIIAAEDKTNAFVESLNKGIELNIGVGLSTDKIAQRMDQITALISEKRTQLAESITMDGDENNMLRGVLPSPETIESDITRLTDLLNQFDTVLSERNLRESEKLKTNFFSRITDAEMEADLAAAIAIEEKYGDAIKNTQENIHAVMLNNERAYQSAIYNAQTQAFQLGVGLLQRFAGENKAINAVLIALQTALSIRNIQTQATTAATQVEIQSTAAAAQIIAYGAVEAAAHAAQFNYAAAAAAVARATASAGLIKTQAAIATASILSAANISAALAVATGAVDIAQLGNTGGVNAPVGTVTNPAIITTAATDTSLTTGSRSVGTITINVNGVVTEEVLQDLIIPAIQDATNDKDVVLFRSDSRQALELEA